jgi:ketosteroid isomerase-like protein
MHDVAAELVENCKTGKEMAGLDTLYHPDAVSVEAGAMPGDSPIRTGIDAIKGKHAWWNDNFTVHSTTVDGPFPHGDDKFAVIFEMDSTMKASGQRSTMREVAVYHVKDGLIVREEFFYAMGG